MRSMMKLVLAFATLACSRMADSGELVGTFQQPLGVIAADDTAMYGLGGDLERIPLSGGAAVVLASGLDGFNLLVTGESLLWYEQVDKTVVSLPKAGGSPRVLASSQYDLEFLQSDGTNLYWTTNDYLTATEPWTIRSMPLGGGQVTELLNITGVAISAMVVDETRIYFLTENRGGTVPQTGPYGIQSIPKDGSSPPVMLRPSNGYSLGGLRRVGTGLFWVESGELRRMDLSTGELSTYARLPLGGGSISFVMDTAGAFNFVQECGDKYSGCGTWMRTLPGGADRAYVHGFAYAAVLDARFVYWVVGNAHELRRVRR